MAGGGDDKKEKNTKKDETAPVEKTWADNFRGYEKYNKNGIQILESTDKEHPFEVVIKGGQKKIIPPLPDGVDPQTLDFKHLPDVDEKDYNKTVQNLDAYKKDLTVDKDLMTEYNQFTGWLKEKGYAGKPEMNHLDYSKKVMDEYKAENPNARLNYNHILPIQQKIHDYRDYFIDQIKGGKAKIDFTPNEDYSNVMAWAAGGLGSKDDGRLGQQTSQFTFPSAYLNEKTPENRLGFVPSPEDQKQGNDIMKETPPMETGQGVFFGGRRVGELFSKDGKNTIKFRGDNGYTGEEVELPKEDLQKYLGTTNSFQTQQQYNELKSKGKKPETVTASSN